MTTLSDTLSLEQQRETARMLYGQGHDINEIATSLDRPYNRIWNWVTGGSTDCYKIKAWKGKSSAEERQRAVDLYHELGTIPKVCQAMDRNYETVRRWLKNAGVDTSIKPKPKTTTKKSKLEQRIAELEEENKKLRETIVKLASTI